MIIGDDSSDEESNQERASRDSVKHARTFFESLSKKEESVQLDLKKGKHKNIFATQKERPELKKLASEEKPNAFRQLMTTKALKDKSPEKKLQKKRVNIFASSKDSSQPASRQETIIGDSSSDEEEKKKHADNQERDSYRNSGSKHSFGAKEGVVQSANFDVATLTNYHEALIKYNKDDFGYKSEK